MKSLLLAASLCLGLVASGSSTQAATLSTAGDGTGVTPRVVPVWWAGPSTVCHRNMYGGVWCRPAAPAYWLSRPYGWGPYGTPGYWRRTW